MEFNRAMVAKKENCEDYGVIANLPDAFCLFTKEERQKVAENVKRMEEIYPDFKVERLEHALNSSLVFFGDKHC